MWEIYWIAKILKNLVNDTQFDRFSPSLLVITVKLLKICHHACMLIGGLAKYGAYFMYVRTQVFLR